MGLANLQLARGQALIPRYQRREFLIWPRRFSMSAADAIIRRQIVSCTLLHLLRSGIDVVDGARSRRRIAVR